MRIVSRSSCCPPQLLSFIYRPPPPSKSSWISLSSSKTVSSRSAVASHIPRSRRRLSTPTLSAMTWQGGKRHLMHPNCTSPSTRPCLPTTINPPFDVSYKHVCHLLTIHPHSFPGCCKHRGRDLLECQRCCRRSGIYMTHRPRSNNQATTVCGYAEIPCVKM